MDALWRIIMNITHIKDDSITVPELPLRGIFERQLELHKKYKPIEEANGIGLSLVKDRPFSLDDPKWQYIIKDFAWRITEELAEANEAAIFEHEEHTIEELIDALHFYTELLIMCGVTYDEIDVCNICVFSAARFWKPVYFLGIACNFLKCKPWKNTHVMTDANRFRSALITGYSLLMMDILASSVHGKTISTMENVYMIYFKKSLVNQFRMDSNY